MKLSELARETGGRITREGEIDALVCDSRVTGKGDLFFCYRGTGEDSHAYAEEAVRRGVNALMCEHELDLDVPQLIVSEGREAMAKIAAAFYGHPERALKIVGVTGTNGKTTVSHMFRDILRAEGENVGLIGTLGSSYGDTVLPPTLTTPDPVALFSMLADMKRGGTGTVVMECSAHALALKKECPITYEAAVFTNLTRDHLDFFGDMKPYGEAKKLLFRRTKCAVLNADDAFTGELLACGAPCVTYGLDSPADCFAIPEREDIGGSRSVFNLNDEICEVELSLTGRHNLYNALAAGAAAQRLGASLSAIARGLKTTRVEGRLERVATYNGGTVFVDFAHTGDGLEKSLSALRPFTAGRLIVLFGCGGNRDREKRPIMGATAARLADFAVLTSDNPRYEDPMAILAQIEAGFRTVSEKYVVIEERERAIAYALSILQKGDVLLLAGKGGETYREVMGIKYDYNDKDVIKSILGTQK